VADKNKPDNDSLLTKYVYKCQVPTTNVLKKNFTMDGRYCECREGFVYVVARSIDEAAMKMPIARLIEEVGVAFV
jgi:hypothetical protein